MRALLLGAACALLACLGAGDLRAQSNDYNKGTYFPAPPWLPSATRDQPTQTEPANAAEPPGQSTTDKRTSPPSGSDLMSQPRPPDRNAQETAMPPETRPFGVNLFQGQFVAQQEAGLNPNYVIAPGDRVLVNLWGAQQFTGQLIVDAPGNIFIPEVGPVHVAGVSNRELNQVVAAKVSSVFSRNVMVYTSLATAQPVGILVSGFVARPGRYAGVPSASMLYYIDRAGGILDEQGSFRDIRILRHGTPIVTADLYDFMLEGKLPAPQFVDGDTIFVGRKKYMVSASGDVQNPAVFEFKEEAVSGEQLIKLAAPGVAVTNVAVSGIRKGEPYRSYMSLGEFGRSTVRNGDSARFMSDGRSDRIFVNIEGQLRGPSVLAVRLGAKLSDVLNLIEVDPSRANTAAVFLRRRSVAEAQKKAIEDSLFRLQKSALTARAASDGVAQIRQGEAKLITEFVARATKIRPEGRVVLATQNGPADIALEPDDVIVIPRKSDVVQVSGEVVLPHDVVYQPGGDVSRYVEMAGGFSERADRNHILLIRQGGEVLDASRVSIKPGDYIMVLPEIDVKSFQLGKELAQVLYQIAVSAAVVLNL